jgi:hypothetical protein
MKHLTETQLNEYLDGELETAVQGHILAHLSACADCRARLASLQTVFKALADLPEVTQRHDLTQNVLTRLPSRFSGLAWRMAYALQASISIGLLILLAPIGTDRLSGIIQRLAGTFARPDMKFPMPIDLHFSLPVFHLPHPPALRLPIGITPANSPVWIILGIAAFLLFVVGNFSLIFHGITGNQE